MVQQWGVATATRHFVGGDIAGDVNITGNLSVSGEAEIEDLTVNGDSVIDGADLSIPNLPTADPSVADQAWADSDVVTVSSP